MAYEMNAAVGKIHVGVTCLAFLVLVSMHPVMLWLRVGFNQMCTVGLYCGCGNRKWWMLDFNTAG